MVIMTQLPTRQLSKEYRSRSLMHTLQVEEASIIELLRRVQIRFDQDEAETAANLLHYTDIALLDLQSPASSDERVLMTLPAEVNSEQWKAPRSYQLPPPIPTRLSKETLEEMMNVSYVECDDDSYEDTTADSRLVDWLATFADPDFEKSPSANKSMKSSFSLNTYSMKSPRHVQHHCDYEAPNHDSTTTLLRIESADDAPVTHRAPPSSPKWPFHRRNFSEPMEPQPDTIMTRRLPETVAQNPNRSFSERFSSQTQSAESIRSRASKPLDTPILDTPVQFADVYASPFLDSKQNKTIVEDNILLHGEDYVIGGDCSFNYGSSLAKHSIFPPSYIEQLSADEQSQYREFEETISSIIMDTPADPVSSDISDIHRFNLSLQHASKSPFLLRNWKNVLLELTSKLPFDLASRFESTESQAPDTPIETQSSPSTCLNLDDDSIENCHKNTDESFLDPTPVVQPPTQVRTQAEIILDREYMGHLRKSIEIKKNEVQMLYSLIVQRKETIRKMEAALKKRAMEMVQQHR